MGFSRPGARLGPATVPSEDGSPVPNLPLYVLRSLKKAKSPKGSEKNFARSPCVRREWDHPGAEGSHFASYERDYGDKSLELKRLHWQAGV